MLLEELEVLCCRDGATVSSVPLTLRAGGWARRPGVPGVPLALGSFQSVFPDVVFNSMFTTTPAREVRQVVLALICRQKAVAQGKCLPGVPWLLSGGARREPSSLTPCPMLLLLHAAPHQGQ